MITVKTRLEKFKNQFNLKNLLKIFCSIMCLIQLKKISLLYFKYETTVDIRFENELYFSLPSMTLCFPKVFFLRKGFTTDNKNCTISEQNHWLNENLTIREQMAVLQLPEDMFRNNCLIYRPIGFSGQLSEFYIPCDQVSEYRLSLSRQHLCLTLFSQLLNESEDMYLIDYDIQHRNDKMSQLKFNNLSSFDYIVLHIHSRNRIIHHNFDKDYKVLDVRFDRIFLDYRKTSVELLPKPYRTGCVDHVKYGFKHRYDRLIDCKLKLFLETTGKFPHNFLAYDLNSSLKFDNKLRSDLDIKISDQCKRLYDPSPDCYAEYFKIDEVLPMSDPGKMKRNLFISFPGVPTTVITHKPGIYLEEFLCYIASIFSLWFGFSMLFLSEIFVEFFKQINCKIK